LDASLESAFNGHPRGILRSFAKLNSQVTGQRKVDDEAIFPLSFFAFFQTYIRGKDKEKEEKS